MSRSHLFCTKNKEGPTKLNSGVPSAYLLHSLKFKVMPQDGTGAAQEVISFQDLKYRVQKAHASAFNIRLYPLI